MAMQLAASNRSCCGRALPRAVRVTQRRHTAVYASPDLDGATKRLQEAAELLAKEAAEQSQASSVALSKDAVAELKRIAALTQTAVSKLESLQVQLGAAAVADAATAAAAAAAATQAQHHAVTQTLQWAVSQAGRVAFIYRDEDHHICKSGPLIKGILRTFISRRGSWLPNGCYIGPHAQYDPEADLDTMRQAFRDALSDHIHKLTGVEPRIVLEKNGEEDQYAIYWG